MPEIIVKNYSHINSALPNWDTPRGKLIKSKDHYDRCVKEAGMTSYENIKSPQRKEYQISDKAREIIRTAKNSVDKKGNVRLSDRTIDAMRSLR